MTRLLVLTLRTLDALPSLFVAWRLTAEEMAYHAAQKGRA